MHSSDWIKVATNARIRNNETLVYWLQKIIQAVKFIGKQILD